MKTFFRLSRIITAILVFIASLLFLPSLNAQTDTTPSLYSFKLPYEIYGITEFKGNLLVSTKSKWLIVSYSGIILDSSRSGSFPASLTYLNGRLYAARNSGTFTKFLYELDTATFAIIRTMAVKTKNQVLLSVTNDGLKLYYLDASATELAFSASDTLTNTYTFDKNIPQSFIVNQGNSGVPTIAIENQIVQKNQFWFAGTIVRNSGGRISVIRNTDSSFQRAKREIFVEIDSLFSNIFSPITAIAFVPTGSPLSGLELNLFVALRNGTVKIYNPSQNEMKPEPISRISPSTNSPLIINRSFTPIYSVRNETYYRIDSLYAEFEITNAQNQSIYKSIKRAKPLENWDEDTVVFEPLKQGLPKGEYSATIRLKTDTLAYEITRKSSNFKVLELGSDKTNRKVGYLSANRVKTKFQNDGLIGAKTYISPFLPTFGWPVPENEYIYDMSFVLGTQRLFRDTLVLPFVGSTNYTRLRDNASVPAPIQNPRRIITPIQYQGKDAFDVIDTAVYMTTHQGPRGGGYRIINSVFEGLQPQLLEFNPNNAELPSMAVKSSKTSYPNAWGGNWFTRRLDGIPDAQEEAYFILDDATDRRWFDDYGYLPFNQPGVYGAGFSVEARYLQFTRNDLQDAIVFTYNIKNNTAEAMQKVIVGNVVGTAVGRQFQRNVSLINKPLNLTYTYNPGGEVDAAWNKTYPVGYVGVKLLETPNQLGLTSWAYDLSSMPRMGDSENLLEFLRPGRFDDQLPTPRDGDYTQGTGFFSLDAGASIRYAYAVVFGENYDKLVANAIAIQNAYDSVMVGFTVETPLSTKAAQPKIARFELQQNFPNPFNPTTTIQFMIPNRSQIDLEVFDVLGRKVAVLERGIKDQGVHTLQFNASFLASGVYFYRLKAASGFMETKKMILVK